MPKKLTIEEVKERIKVLHGDSLMLCEETYTGSQVKAKFIHKNYERPWWVKPTFVLQGKNHPSIGIERRSKAQELPVGVIKDRIVEKHGDRIVLIESTYIDTHTICTFFDKLFNKEFQAYPQHVYIRGDTHPDGKKEKREKNNIVRIGVPYHLQKEEFKEKHRNTVKSKFGVENVSQLEEIKEKKKKTSLKNNGVEHPMQSAEIRERAKRNSLNKHGFEYPMQVQEIALKAARSANNCIIKFHWKTGEELVCQGSYEAKTIDYLNSKQIDFHWQPKTFEMPNGKTYRPDLYLLDQNIWVEIKGWMRKDAQEKWDWLKTQFSTAELWNKKKLRSMGIKVR
jgi:hypothetical protein